MNGFRVAALFLALAVAPGACVVVGASGIDVPGAGWIASLVVLIAAGSLYNLGKDKS